MNVTAKLFSESAVSSEGPSRQAPAGLSACRRCWYWCCYWYWYGMVLYGIVQSRSAVQCDVA